MVLPCREAELAHLSPLVWAGGPEQTLRDAALSSTSPRLRCCHAWRALSTHGYRRRSFYFKHRSYPHATCSSIIPMSTIPSLSAALQTGLTASIAQEHLVAHDTLAEQLCSATHIVTDVKGSRAGGKLSLLMRAQGARGRHGHPCVQLRHRRGARGVRAHCLVGVLPDRRRGRGHARHAAWQGRPAGRCGRHAARCAAASCGAPFNSVLSCCNTKVGQQQSCVRICKAFCTYVLHQKIILHSCLTSCYGSFKVSP